jgi:hypothetical protein
MTIHLSPDLELALSQEAERRGTTPQALAIRLIELQLPSDKQEQESGKEPATIGEWLKPFLDSLPPKDPNRPPSRLSEDSGRKFAELLREKRRQGRA